jgi:HK97 family phage major capsid protein
MPPRERLSDRLTVTPGGKRVITGEEFSDMRRQAQELEQGAGQLEADNRELRGRLEVREPDVYGPGSSHSWFRDVAQVALKDGDGDGGPKAAAGRLEAHQRHEHRRDARRLQWLQAERELESALTRDAAQAALYMRWRAAGGNLFDKHDEMRDIEHRSGATRTQGSGGYFAPPGWLVDQFVHAPRAGAPLAALMTRLPLPQGVVSINVPQFATGGGTGTGVQSADGGAVTVRDPKDGTAKAVIRTLAANLDASMQLMDQSPVPFDATFGADIAEDMATQLDGQLLLGNSASGGQLNGLIPGGTFSASNALLLQSTNNASSQSWANGGSGIAASAHQMTAQLYSKVARARGLPPTHWVTNPDVWAIISGSADGQNRPLVSPGSLAKTLHGLPVVEDANLTSTFGGTVAPGMSVTSAGVASPADGNGTYAPLLLGRWEDLCYFVAEPRVQVLREVLAGSLGVRFQVTQYVAAMPARIVWGGTNVTYSGTSQSGGVNNGAACAYGAFTQFQTNGPLSPSGAGY